MWVNPTEFHKLWISFPLLKTRLEELRSLVLIYHVRWNNNAVTSLQNSYQSKQNILMSTPWSMKKYHSRVLSLVPLSWGPNEQALPLFQKDMSVHQIIGLGSSFYSEITGLSSLSSAYRECLASSKDNWIHGAEHGWYT